MGVGRQLAHQRRQRLDDLAGLGHHQQPFDLAGLADETALDVDELGVASSGEVDARMQGGAVALAQQDASGLAALESTGRRRRRPGAPQPSSVHWGGGVDFVSGCNRVIRLAWRLNQVGLHSSQPPAGDK